MSPGRTGLFIIALLVLVVPTCVRLLASPVALLLLAPIILIIAAVSFILLNLAVAYVLDAEKRLSAYPLYAIARPLAFSTPAAWDAVQIRSQWSHRSPQSLPPLYPDYPVVSSAVNDILIFIVRDFVLSWYRDLSSSPSFPTAVSGTVHSSLQRVLARAANLDIPALLVNRILPKITAHIEQFRESEMALRGAGLERRLTQSEELDLLLASRYATRGGGKLHQAVDNLSSTFTKQTEENHLRQLIGRALPHILPEKEANSEALKVVVREVLACSVFYPLMDMLVDPDFWNRSIDQVVRESSHLYESEIHTMPLYIGRCRYSSTVSLPYPRV